jgi:hypothetical protein
MRMQVTYQRCNRRPLLKLKAFTFMFGVILPPAPVSCRATAEFFVRHRRPANTNCILSDTRVEPEVVRKVLLRGHDNDNILADRLGTDPLQKQPATRRGRRPGFWLSWGRSRVLRAEWYADGETVGGRGSTG